MQGADIWINLNIDWFYAKVLKIVMILIFILILMLYPLSKQIFYAFQLGLI